MCFRDLFLRMRALVAPHRVERELHEELAFHIEHETQKHIAAGLSPVDARTRALARFGPVPLAADQCRDARGIGIVDALTRDIRYAFRSFRRAPLAALTIIATVGLGLGLVAVVFTVYNFLFLRVDDVRGPGELFSVNMERWTGPDDDVLPLARSDWEAMRRETSAFSGMVAMLDPGGPAYLDGRLTRPIFVSGNFFQMLGAPAALGRPLLPSDDERPAGRAVVALSHFGWRKLFGADPEVIGRRVVIGGAPYEIVGIMPDGFRGLGITPPDYWAPLALSPQVGDPSESRLEIIGRLKPGVSREAAAAALSLWASGRADFVPLPGRPIRVTLTPRRGTLSAEGFGVVFAPLFFAFGLILLIGCANVANLLLARGVSRQKEIGIRVSLGASRGRIIQQLLTESLLLSLAAAVCGLVLARLSLEGLLRGVITTLPLEIVQFVSIFNLSAPPPDWRLVVFLVVAAIVSTVFFGLTPALQATRIDLISTMRGEVSPGAHPRRARHTLIAVQVCASVLLLICAGIFLRGSVAAATKDPGIRTSDTLRASLPDDGPRRTALLQALRSDPLVTTIAAETRMTRGTLSPSGPAQASGPGVLPVNLEAVSSDYFEVLGIELVNGRGFTPTELSAAAGVLIVSEAIARQFWPRGDGVGHTVRLEARSSASRDERPVHVPSGTYTVVGVVRDPTRAAGSDRKTIGDIYVPTAVDTPDAALMLRVRGNPDQARQVLLDRLARIDPTPIMVVSLRTLTRMQSYLLEMGSWIAVILGALALALTVSGLFGVLSYIVEQQSKEIGVRMALGAATGNVVRLILKQSVRPVGLGLAVGGSLAAAVAIVLMATPLAAEIGDGIDVLDPMAYAASVLVIITSCVLAVSVPAWRAARIDPMATLRND